MKRIALLFFLAICVTVTHAQTSIKFDTNLAKPGQATPKECLDQKAVLWSLLALYPHPDRWTYVIACDDPGWNDLMKRMDKRKGEHYGETNFQSEAQITFLRGTTLLGLDDSLEKGLPVITPEHLVTHELGHIYLHSSDEEKVDRLALSWIDNRKTKMLVASK